MMTRLDAIGLALLWTERAARRPDAAADDGPRPGLLPEGLTLANAPSLEALVADPPSLADALRSRAAAAVAHASRCGLGLVAFGDPEYPEPLTRIPDPPPAFWTLGTMPAGRDMIAMVGSRNATAHGLRMAASLAEDLARAGVCVVSGLARGVDGAAHGGALRAGGLTIAVLGSGVDVIYPPEHNGLARDVAAHGALVSEFAPGTPPRGWHFPRRNRLISGLCLGVVVVEASERSGSLITARMALAQGREVLAVPGGVLGGRNRGAHGLLRDGAYVVESAADVLEVFRGVGCGTSDGAPGEEPRAPDPWLRKIDAAQPYDLEALCRASGLEPGAMLARLSELELGGWIVREPGGQFVKVAGNVLR